MKSTQTDLLQRDLLDRGWTKSLISTFLASGPDEVRRRYGGGEVHVYDAARVRGIESTAEWIEAKHKLTRIPKPAKNIDLLAAIFAVTRAAKRCRDAASTCYSKRKHGFAGYWRTKKEKLYALKDRGVAAAYMAKRIHPTRLVGSLVEYHGEGYCFHSLLLPDGCMPEQTGREITVEAKPRETREPRLTDATHTLELLPGTPSGFERLSFPQRERESRPNYSYNYSYNYDDNDDDDYDDEN